MSELVAGNPLRDPRDRRLPRVAGPCVLVMFGVTGDLARKKLMPAVYDLAHGINYHLRLIVSATTPVGISKVSDTAPCATPMSTS